LSASTLPAQTISSNMQFVKHISSGMALPRQGAPMRHSAGGWGKGIQWVAFTASPLSAYRRPFIAFQPVKATPTS